MLLLVVANVAINLGLVWLLLRLRTLRLRATREELRRGVQLLGQQVRALEQTLAGDTDEVRS